MKRYYPRAGALAADGYNRFSDEQWFLESDKWNQSVIDSFFSLLEDDLEVVAAFSSTFMSQQDRITRIIQTLDDITRVVEAPISLQLKLELQEHIGFAQNLISNTRRVGTCCVTFIHGLYQPYKRQAMQTQNFHNNEINQLNRRLQGIKTRLEANVMYVTKHV